MVARIEMDSSTRTSVCNAPPMVEHYMAMRSWNDAGIPIRHRQALELRHEAAGPWLDTYRGLSARIGEGFLVALLGKRGTGKTQLAVCLLRDAAEACRTVKYIKALDLFRELRSCFRPDGPDENKMLDRYRRYGLLVIDEAHERGETDFENRSLTNLIDKRYDAMVDTILIGNETREAFAENVGLSIVSRILETGEAIVCDWQSFRTAEHRRERAPVTYRVEPREDR